MSIDPNSANFAYDTVVGDSIKSENNLRSIESVKLTAAVRDWGIAIRCLQEWHATGKALPQSFEISHVPNGSFWILQARRDGYTVIHRLSDVQVRYGIRPIIIFEDAAVSMADAMDLRAQSVNYKQGDPK